jgi:CRISPR-associated protein (TIGR03984 family)
VERKITNGLSESTLVAVPQDSDLRAWLQGQAVEYGLRWLLAHADNGVIWGELRDGVLRLSSDAFGLPELRLDEETFQQVRLFGEAGELRVWRGPGSLVAHLWRDDAGVTTEWLDELYLLWGWAADPAVLYDGFIELVEGRQGITHAPPLTTAPSEKHRASLLVRHYLAVDEITGAARVVDSRLVKLKPPA